MKKVIIVLCAVLFSTNAFSQSIELESLDTLSVEYIQLLAVEKMTNKARIVLDYGAPKVGAVMESGKPFVFNSTIHALNVMYENGYEVVYPIGSVPGMPGYRFLLKKRTDIK